MRVTLSDFINTSNKVHNFKYDYSLVEYVASKIKVKIICPEHDFFYQAPQDHKKGRGCNKCAQTLKSNLNSSNKDEFIKKAIKIHGNKFDYSLVNYVNSKIKIKIVCPYHGEFEQIPNSHLIGSECMQCAVKKRNESLIITNELFIEKANKKHNNLYDYSLSVYKAYNIKLKIICSKHGVFEQVAYYHLNGNGCQSCKISKGENAIKKYLESIYVNFTINKKFDDCKHINHLPFDFYLPEYKMCIEFDGGQHFKPVSFFEGEKGFLLTQKRDKIKNEYCEKNNIPLLRIPFTDFDNIESLVNDFIVKNKKSC